MSQKTPLALEYIRALRDDRTLSSTEKLFAFAIASHAGHDGTNAHPGHKLLGDETATSERTSKRTVAALVEKGWLVQTSSGRGNSRYASVYALAIPQGATHSTLDEPTVQIQQAKVPNETGQSAISGSQGATGGPTNQPVEITKEIPLSQVSDDDAGKQSTVQELTDRQEETGLPGDEGGDPGRDRYTPQTVVDDINKIISDNWDDRPGFDARFVKTGVLDSLTTLMNLHEVDVHDIFWGMFESHPALGNADHDPRRIKDPARFFSRQLDGDLGLVIAYGERGREIWNAQERDDQAAELAARDAQATGERVERDLWESTEAERNKILATMTGHVPARVRPLADAWFRTWYTQGSVPIWQHPEFHVVFAGNDSKHTGPDWIKGYLLRNDWDRIKDQDVIPLRQES